MPPLFRVLHMLKISEGREMPHVQILLLGLFASAIASRNRLSVKLRPVKNTAWSAGKCGFGE